MIPNKSIQSNVVVYLLSQIIYVITGSTAGTNYGSEIYNQTNVSGLFTSQSYQFLI